MLVIVLATNSLWYESFFYVDSVAVFTLQTLLLVALALVLAPHTHRAWRWVGYPMIIGFGLWLYNMTEGCGMCWIVRSEASKIFSIIFIVVSMLVIGISAWRYKGPSFSSRDGKH